MGPSNIIIKKLTSDFFNAYKRYKVAKVKDKYFLNISTMLEASA